MVSTSSLAKQSPSPAQKVEPLAQGATADSSQSSHGNKEERVEWITIIIHGTVGFQANLCYKTILQAQADCIEGSDYERKVLAMREDPYLFSLQPMQRIGLHKVPTTDNELNAASTFVSLYKDVQHACGIREKGEFYTFGWSGLISIKRRYAEARILYKKIREKIGTYHKSGKKVKVRLIGYSHGATLLLNIADIRACEFPADTFVINEAILLGLPINRRAHIQITSPVFEKIYNIYSREDAVQTLDAFSQDDFFSSREFIGPCLPQSLTQIEMKVTACFRRDGRCLPSRMRGLYNQSPGHIELWFFGWAHSGYRQNLNIYPLPAAVFIPYVKCAAHKLCCKNVLVDLRPNQNIVRIRANTGVAKTNLASLAKTGIECATMPFLNAKTYEALREKAMELHPHNQEYKRSIARIEKTLV